MSIISIPPIRDPLVSVTLNLPARVVDVSPLTATWQQWFSNIFAAIDQLTLAGTTVQRPNPPPFIGCMYFDTTLGKPIWAKTASVWVDATGASV